MKDKSKKKVEIMVGAYRHFLAPIIIIKTDREFKENKNN